MGIQADRIVTPKGGRKETRIREFMYKNSRMRNVKYIIMPVIVGANLIVLKVLKKNVETIQRKRPVDSL